MGLQNNMVPYDRRCARSRSPPNTPPPKKMDTPVISWKLGEAVEAENGLKFASLTTASGPIILTLSGIAPFEPSSWQDDALVKNPDLRLDALTESKLECMQACIAEKYGLPKYSTEGFKPFLHKRDDFPANLRVKLQAKGLTKTRFWSKEDKKLTKAPEHFAGATFDAKVLLKGVWYSESCWGVSLQATDLMITKEAQLPDCPF
jgi:hypothetical protein